MLSYCMSIVLAFSCGRAKKIPIHYFWTRIFSKTEKKIFVFKTIRIRGRGFRITLTANGKPQHVTRNQVFSLIIVYYSLFLHKNRKFHVRFIHKKIILRRFYLFISPFQKVIVNLNVTTAVCLERFSKSLYRENRRSHRRKFKRVTPPPPPPPSPLFSRERSLAIIRSPLDYASATTKSTSVLHSWQLYSWIYVNIRRKLSRTPIDTPGMYELKTCAHITGRTFEAYRRHIRPVLNVLEERQFGRSLIWSLRLEDRG